VTEDPSEILVMLRTLTEIGYRDLCKDGGPKRLALARGLQKAGVTDLVLRMLWDFARTADKYGSPERLLCYWLGNPRVTMMKIAEMRRHNVWLAKRYDDAQKMPPDAVEAPIIDIKTQKKV